MTTIGNVNFCGTTVSQPSSAQYGTQQMAYTNFKAQSADTYNGKTKKSHPGRTIFGIVATAALAIAGLGYTHKAGWINKMSEGKFKNFSETVTGKCDHWCKWTKVNSKLAWRSLKTKFSKK